MFNMVRRTISDTTSGLFGGGSSFVSVVSVVASFCFVSAPGTSFVSVPVSFCSFCSPIPFFSSS